MLISSDNSRSLLGAGSVARHIYLARYEYLQVVRFVVEIYITYLVSSLCSCAGSFKMVSFLLYAGDYDLKVMRQEFYINRQKGVLTIHLIVYSHFA